jgi:enamine deaminase RidA (YjgF/YER057c/UK114 family)
VGADLTVDQGYEAARLTALNILATLRTNLGSLDRIRRVVKVTGMVQAAPGFTEHSRVVNGCSDLLFQVLGEAGRHARSAVGMASLPFGAAVEIEAIVEVS